MFKERCWIFRLRLIAGAGYTHPMQVKAINKGWPPPKIEGNEISAGPFIDEAGNVPDLKEQLEKSVAVAND